MARRASRVRGTTAWPAGTTRPYLPLRALDDGVLEVGVVDDDAGLGRGSYLVDVQPLAHRKARRVEPERLLVAFEVGVATDSTRERDIRIGVKPDAYVPMVIVFRAHPEDAVHDENRV